MNGTVMSFYEKNKRNGGGKYFDVVMNVGGNQLF